VNPVTCDVVSLDSNARDFPTSNRKWFLEFDAYYVRSHKLTPLLQVLSALLEDDIAVTNR
jgi:hypothetical protein